MNIMLQMFFGMLFLRVCECYNSVMKIRELIKNIDYEYLQGDLDGEICGLSHDNRLLKPQEGFICIAGTRFDSHDLIPDVLIDSIGVGNLAAFRSDSISKTGLQILIVLCIVFGFVSSQSCCICLLYEII